ncbi:MAG: hypothetical protein ABSB42_14035 [Tepidisphaeraceae bacterium]
MARMQLSCTLDDGRADFDYVKRATREKLVVDRQQFRVAFAQRLHAAFQTGKPRCHNDASGDFLRLPDASQYFFSQWRGAFDAINDRAGVQI